MTTVRKVLLADPDLTSVRALTRALRQKGYQVYSARDGARALERGHLLEHLYREVRAPRIYEGASEVQRGIIAKELYATATREDHP